MLKGLQENSILNALDVLSQDSSDYYCVFMNNANTEKNVFVFIVSSVQNGEYPFLDEGCHYIEQHGFKYINVDNINNKNSNMLVSKILNGFGFQNETDSLDTDHGFYDYVFEFSGIDGRVFVVTTHEYHRIVETFEHYKLINKNVLKFLEII